jgi:type II secretory pathway component PulK
MRRRRAMVSVMAIMLVGLVAVALAGLTALVGTAARQATQAREEAQAEQLLIAGAELARQGGAGGKVELPKALEGATLTIQGKRVEAAVGRARLTAE